MWIVLNFFALVIFIKGMLHPKMKTVPNCTQTCMSFSSAEQKARYLQFFGTIDFHNRKKISYGSQWFFKISSFVLSRKTHTGLQQLELD